MSNVYLPYRSLYSACKIGNIKDVWKMIEKGFQQWQDGYLGACEASNVELIELMISFGAMVTEETLRRLCFKGNIEVVKILLDNTSIYSRNGIFFANYGMFDACQTGNLELVDVLINYGAFNYDKGLYGACHGNQLDLVKLMIKYGATDYNGAMKNIGRFTDVNIIHLLMEKGANCIQEGLNISIQVRNMKLAKFFLVFDFLTLYYEPNDSMVSELIENGVSMEQLKTTLKIRSYASLSCYFRSYDNMTYMVCEDDYSFDNKNNLNDEIEDVFRDIIYSKTDTEKILINYFINDIIKIISSYFFNIDIKKIKFTEKYNKLIKI